MTSTRPSLRFALGPVQSFFAQSRRTRDLWSSSFLVSYLSACAVDTFEEADGARVVLPDVEGDRLVNAVRAIRLKDRVDDPPEIGSVPNQLTVEAQDPDVLARAARLAAARIVEAWRRITEAVWAEIAQAAGGGRETKHIWARQLGSFWQIHWTMGGADALRSRKAWRGRARLGEPGDKCTLMPGWQELSGYHRATERGLQNKFWQKLRKGLGSHALNAEERLCSLAMVKRLFPSVADQAIGWKLDTVHWPSTPYLAARPWVEDLLNCGDSSLIKKAEEYEQCVQLVAPKAEAREKGAKRIPPAGPSTESGFRQLGGTYLFERDWDDPDRTPLNDAEEGERQGLKDLLNEVYDQARKAGRRHKPSPFYALLQLDGDHLGSLFGSSENPAETSKALARFARQAEDLIRDRLGLTVYAGGDDLVAFLALPTAVSTAVELAKLYVSVLQPAAGPELKVTTSAALVFAHCRSPLRSVVAEGHRMLDEDAKDGNGRGSIAVALWKGAGVTARWVTTWEQLVPDWPSQPAEPEAVSSPPHRIEVLARRLGRDEISKSFLYGQRQVLTRLAGNEPWRPGLTVELPSEIEPEALVRAELARARSLRNDEEDLGLVATMTRELVELMKPGHRDDHGHSYLPLRRLAFDPLFLAHFLDVESPGEVK